MGVLCLYNKNYKVKDQLIKYLKNQCTLEEAAQVIQFVSTEEGKAMMSKILAENTYENTNKTLSLNSDELWQQILSNTVKTNQSIEKEQQTNGRIVSFRPMRLWWAAAAIVPLLMLGAYWYLQNKSTIQQVENTTYGQTKKIVLSDGSEVVLNGNSSLKYTKNWGSSEPREVWLNGEAFFKITHQSNHQKFLVHTKHQQIIEVLGTEFNVSDRKNGVSVVLKSGKIKLTVPKNTKTESLVMKPGQRVEMDTSSKRVQVAIVKPEIYTSWQSHKLIFEKTKLSEIAQMLNETYNLKIIVENPQLLDERVSGTIPSGNVNELINALSIALQVKYSQDNNTVRFF